MALTAQGFADRPPSGAPTRAHLKRVLARTRLLQMDSVNVLARAHYLPVFSRLGPYDDRLLERAAWESPARSPRLLAEYWAHEAALIPLDDWPLFGWRMARYAGGRWRHTREVLQRNPALIDDVVAVIDQTGASTPRQIEAALGIRAAATRPGSWWVRGEVKQVCEALFAEGRLSATRDQNFTRHYDLADRVLGRDIVARRIGETDAVRALVRRAAAAHGVATAADLADYYRLDAAQVRPVLPDLVDEGTLTPVRVEGWTEDAYLHADARAARSMPRSTLLSPFDPLIFFRPRTQRLFGFHYRLEIYVPKARRVHGYYVLPYLLDGQLVARVDLKADRGERVLRVLAAHHEPGVDTGEVAAALAADLQRLAAWRNLDTVRIAGPGDLAPALTRSCR
ncbi:hypothetical protein GOHSU_42_00230 [Gordonia hirsuta DSM 44140 = NBRC 16056]|uniref:Winged helix-turn-helix domain-containing protein n=1 Tax=Gordonia hirsuta DSM 44140 = NBRC 16056 TaxID=1121927 RepID=L7LCT1_9ACTN|nr:hypothetical protein GOHSU_42_00230 [Gordonia hirsuta DSM 44140 = NBRC 16056]